MPEFPWLPKRLLDVGLPHASSSRLTPLAAEPPAVRTLKALLMASAGGVAIDKERLYGTWNLVSYTRRAANRETTNPFGKAPRGILNYGRDGRIFAMIVKDERPGIVNPSEPTDHELAGLFDTMAAYGGTFTVAGNTVTHHVDISWNASWTGTDQVRTVRLEGGKLFITAVEAGFVFALVWERVK